MPDARGWEVAWADYVACLKTADEARADVESGWQPSGPIEFTAGWPTPQQRLRQAEAELAEAERRLEGYNGHP